MKKLKIQFDLMKKTIWLDEKDNLTWWKRPFDMKKTIWLDEKTKNTIWLDEKDNLTWWKN